MSEVTVNQLASTVGIPVERLLAQLQEAGISAADGEARLTEQEKVQLQSYITSCYGSLTSFNVLFADEEDRFRGAGGR